jgi:hypothetical protein
MGPDERWVAFNVECSFIEFSVDVVHGFEGIVLEYFLANLIPEVFLRV